MRNKQIKIMVGKPTGFCFGVKRAIAIVKREAKKAQGKNPVYTLGPIIHNNQVLKELQSLNVKIISDVNELKQKPLGGPIVIIRSHGCAPAQVEKIKQKGYQVIDATCPYVKRVQNYAVSLKNNGYYTVVVGDKNHPEVKGIIGYAGRQAQVFDINSKVKSQKSKLNHRPVGMVAQTTISRQDFQNAVSAFSAHDYRELRIFNTLCQESQNRQNTCQNLANNVNLMIVVGSRSSANTTSLAEIAKKSCRRVYKIENKKELNRKWFSNLCRKREKVLRIGVIAGASTPQHTVFEVTQELGSVLKNSIAGGHNKND